MGCQPTRAVIEIRAVRADQPPADALVAAILAAGTRLYGSLEGRIAPSATPDELWAPHGTYLVVFADGAPVAGGGLKGLGPHVAEVKRMFVVEPARGRGYARRLLTALEDAARELGHTRLRLDTGPKQPFARALYESAGYRSIPAYNKNPAATFWGEKRLDLCSLALRAEPAKAERLLLVQRAAYAAEAELMGVDGLPPLHETLEELLEAEDQRWLGRFEGPRLVGGLAWGEDGAAGVELLRLVVAPAAWRRGHATALLDAFDELVGPRPVSVSTSSANAPALALYARRGCRVVGEEEIAPGVRLTRMLRPGGKRWR
jgi:GNAT superfamily N-acetyltransferase